MLQPSRAPRRSRNAMPADKATENRPFKDLINVAVVSELAARLAAVDDDFAEQDFIAAASDGLLDLELKDRIRHVAGAVKTHLADDFPTAARHVVACLPPPLQSTEEVTSGGFMIWVLCQYVQDSGLEHFEAAFAAMKELTQRFSCEFAVRPYLVRYPDRSMAMLHEWAADANPHVRRLVSEGTRPRLPWGQRLRAFVADPEPTLALLEHLKDDPELYVRRSVANHLNDIAKDHPERTVQVCGQWMQGASKERAWLVRHALRSLVKAGHSGALAVLGFGPAEVAEATLEVTPDRVAIGGHVRLSLRLVSASSAAQQLVIDYAVHYQKARGTSAKVFKWRTCSLPANEALSADKKQHFKDVSVRRHRPGPHRIVLLVNGAEMAETTVTLLAD